MSTDNPERPEKPEPQPTIAWNPEDSADETEAPTPPPDKPEPQPTIAWDPNEAPEEPPQPPSADKPEAQPTVVWGSDPIEPEAGGATPPEDAAPGGEDSPEEEEEDALVGQVLRGKWKVLKKLGAGSFGSVYKVEDIKGGWTEALKVLGVDRLTGAEAENARKRFLREAQIMKRLGTESQHIVGLATYEEDLEAGRIYFTMELVEGQSLADLVFHEGPQPLERTLRLAMQACDALTVAHEGPDAVVHRDLKLENLMLTKDRAGNEIVKVLDFGIAKIAEKEHDSRLTTVGTLGTPGYAAPEQLRAEAVDGRTDLFAFGVILYAMLTGKDPWLGNPAGHPTHQIYELMVQTERGEVRSMRETGVEVPPAMESIVLKLLRRDPDERYANARELKEALARVASGAVADEVGSLRVMTGEPGVKVQIRSGRQVVAEGATPFTANELVAGSYRIDVVDPRYERTSTTVSLDVGALEDVTLVTSARGTGKRSPSRALVAAVAVLALGGAGAFILRPWGVTLDAAELGARAGDIASARLTQAGLEGRLARGALPPLAFRSDVAQGERLAVVERLRAAGTPVDASWEVDRLVERAAMAQSELRYFGSPEADVRSYAEQAAAFDPGSAAAQSLLLKVAERMAWDAEAAAEEGAGERARELAADCLTLVPEHARCRAVAGGA
jgi:serine/threonine-protein kinase